MRALITLHHRVFGALEAQSGAVLPTLARAVFAGTLFFYFWNSALTKLGDGIFTPNINAYIQIFPRAFEAAGFSPSGLGPLATPIVLLGTYAEFVLPVLLVIGLFTRIAALGMIGFVAVQSWVDVMGHGVGGDDLGAWFDGTADALILDQRAFWVLLFLVLVFRGAGPLSVDALLRRGQAAPDADHSSAVRTAASQPR